MYYWITSLKIKKLNDFKRFKNLLLQHENKLINILICILILQVILHLLSYQYPFFNEDEALYLLFGQNRGVSLDSGIIWRYFTNIDLLFFSGSELKLFPLILGLLSALCLYQIMRDGIKLSVSISLIFTIVFISSPIFYSQSHRIRPEILHVFISLLSLIIYIYSYLKKSRSLFFVGTICFLSIIHTHIMSILNLPGLYVVISYIIYDHTRSFKKALLYVLGIIIIQFLSLYFLIPGLLNYNVYQADSFNISGFTDLILKSWASFLISFKVWYWDLRGSNYTLINYLFSSGYHLTVEGVVLYVESLIAGLIFLVYFYIKRNLSLPFVIALGSFINCICYFIAIVFFKRINNSYNILLLPWMILSIASIFYPFDLKKHMNFLTMVNFFKYLIISSVFFLFFLYSVHIYKFIFPLRNNNFNNILLKLKNEVKAHNCNDFSFMSCPYFMFFKNPNGKNPIPFGEIIVHYNEQFATNYKNKLMEKNKCVAVIARNYYGFDWWRQFYSSISDLNIILGDHFKVISTIDMPFYKNDPYYPYIKQNTDNISYPMGADTIYIGGKETIWLMKLANTDNY